MAIPVLLDCDPGRPGVRRAFAALLLAHPDLAPRLDQIVVMGGSDLHQVTGRAPNAQVAVHLDTGRFWDLIVAAIATLG
jgi:inosine-uridine nucleoside N-ribohydrolase